MKSMIEFCLKNRVAGNLFAVIIIVSGLISLGTLNVRLFPEIVLNSINITVPYPGATPKEIETSIVKPIEEQVEGLEGVQKITALAAPGIASVLVKLDEGVDISQMLDDVKAEIDRITVFPQRAEEPQVVHSEADELSARIILYGDVARDDLKEIANRVRNDLADQPNISRVRIQGVADYLIDVSIDAHVLEAMGLSLLDVAGRVSQQSLDLSGGQIEGDRQKILVRSTGERRTGDEFEDVVLGASQTGRPVFLKDVATVTDGLSESPLRSVYKGQPAVYISVFRVGDEKLLDLAASVRSYVANDLQAALPEGVSAEFWRDESVMLEQRIDLLSKNAFVGLALVCLLLMAFLDIRIAAWVAFGVGVSFIGAFTLMALFGVTINQLTLFGFILAIGIVVDDAIVVGENIHAVRKLRPDEPMESARLGVLRVSTPVLFSVTTTIIAFVPLLFLPGTFGQFLGPIASVVIAVLILSLFESFFILPRHLSHLTSEPATGFSPRKIADPFRDYFAGKLRVLTEGPLARAIGFCVNRPLITIVVIFSLFIASMTLVTSGAVKFIFFPEIEGDYVNVELELSEATSQQKTASYADYIADMGAVAADKFSLNGVSPLKGVFWTQGVSPVFDGARSSTDGGAAGNKIYVVARLEEAATRSFSALDFQDEWRRLVGDIPGAQKLTFSSDLISPGAPVQLQISTRNEDTTRDAIIAIREKLEAMPGVFDVRDDRFKTTDEVKISLKPLAVSYGLTQNDLATHIRAAFFGAEAVRVQRDREEIKVRVRLPAGQRRNLETLKNMKIMVGEGFIPIEQLATLSVEPAAASINRINGRRVFTLTTEVDTNYTTAGLVTDYVIEDFVPNNTGRFDGLTVTLAGDQEEQSQMAPAISRNFVIAMMVIFTLLALSFKSYSQPIIVMLAIPFGFMGGLLGHAIMGADMTLLSMFGVIGLSGVIINNSLIVVNFINEHLEKGEDIKTAVSESVLERFRAILLTTLTTFLGVTPIILETSVQAQFLVPTALSLGFGIIFGTSILIFLLPALAMVHFRIFGWTSDEGLSYQQVRERKAVDVAE